MEHPSNEIVCETISVNPIKYFQKPIIGEDNGNSVPPIQLVFQGGGFGLGIAVKEHNNTNVAINGEYPVILSGPETSEFDLMEKKGLKIAFLILAFINLVITCLMFTRADIVDLSKVESATNPLPSVFEIISGTRRHIEMNNFSFVLITLFIGSFSVAFDFPLGISVYAISIVLNFLLGTSALPYFIYCLRYVLDSFMLYVGLVYRSRLMYTFLPAHVHRG